MDKPTENMMIDMREFSYYHVKEIESGEHEGGFRIIGADQNSIFGMGSKNDTSEQREQTKNWMLYWCELLNVAYIKGYAHSKGYEGVLMHVDAKKRVDEMFKKL